VSGMAARPVLLVLLGMLGVCVAVVVIGKLYGIRVPRTDSVPRGVYRTVSTDGFRRGQYVLLCPPDTPVIREARWRGYIAWGGCEQDYAYLLKVLAGQGGDVVSVGDDGVRVNGVLIPHSAPRAVDSRGRPMPLERSGIFTLKSNEYLVMSENRDTGFDSRYFGPVRREQLRAVLVPLWLW
jgi:conjugative transfer signal peptidase TraF